MPETQDEITSFLVKPLGEKPPAADEEDEDSEDGEDSSDEVEVNEHGKRKLTSGSDQPKKKIKNSLYSVREHERAFSSCWIALLKHALPQVRQI